MEIDTAQALSAFPCAYSAGHHRAHQPVLAFAARGTVHADPVEPVTPVEPSVWFLINWTRAAGARYQLEGLNGASWRRGSTLSGETWQ